MKMAERLLYKFTQKLLLFTTYFIARVLSNIRVTGRENAYGIKKGPVLIVCNHKSYFDPPLIGICFPLFSAIYPLRFMTADNFFKTPWGWLLFKSLGTFPTYRKQGMEKSLAIPVELLRAGATVIMFPEGRCLREDGLCPAKPGAAVLAAQFPDVPILPVAMSGTHKVFAGMLHFRRQKATIGIGRPFLLADLGEKFRNGTFSTEELSAGLMTRIEEVYRALPQV